MSSSSTLADREYGMTLRQALELEDHIKGLENLLEKISLNPQFEVVGEENTGRVDYAIKALEELIYITESKQYQIAIEISNCIGGVSQYRFHSTSWYKDAKKLEDIVNRDRQKRCICQDNGIFLLEVWYDQNPEIVIPERIRKIKEYVNKAYKVLTSYNQ
ncbi:hypothetical protein GLOIN_2v1838763 [Rhizophagus irregularis DAOM 181602=DAOM 197198]|uniref:Uncharacterized protein n=1 Tax=Rhizophagus irregularis (strain DAOM 181602 / DAOM 197198 / MUCL 43194) TaxID=747089 RepID=A0A2P4QCL5_RHIID|nr:hypothetical protein GLOIN_2v1838763 [Rhizophagus irregularis DAOM 181602=DAOM 197198]POG75383.1 hypothetical protein GLOIN_2v1838763 [Rhizophagus irregularis DAOM 181602=DAOM 197198]|eukprot:XP_025182249.1 hypothetical protein GLOIN_2v1838763 [Rhizophagus irregularis DAOM 181602=DAOM 197198]